MSAIHGAYLVWAGGADYMCDDVTKRKERDSEGRLTGWYIFDLIMGDTVRTYRTASYYLDYPHREIDLGEDATREAEPSE